MDLSVYYPKAISEPLDPAGTPPDKAHFVPGTVTQRNLIVCHITEGTTVDGAIETFRSSVHPYRVSAHFVIGQDGIVTQLLPISATAWHASAVNSRSIGIEHVALSPAGAKEGINGGEPMPATSLQYKASAQLIVWLCQQMGIPVDRAHIAGHNEASPQDGHVECCSGGLNVDQLVAMAKGLNIT